MQIPENIQNFVREEFARLTQKVKLLIRSDMIESSEFPHLVNKYNVSSVPEVIINEDIRFEGSLPEPLFVDKVMEVERYE